jgi:hypothetical protein
MTKAPNPEFLDEYTQWLQLKGLSRNTIKGYTNLLKIIPEDVESYFANPHLKSKKSKMCAYPPLPSFLALGHTLNNRPLHTIWALKNDSLVYIISVYETDPDKWIN